MPSSRLCWPFSVLTDLDTDQLEALDPLHYIPVDVDGGVLTPLFHVVHDQLLGLTDVEGEVVVLAPHCQIIDLHHVGGVIVTGDQAYQIKSNQMYLYRPSYIS